MKDTEPFEFDLPPGATVRGPTYSDRPREGPRYDLYIDLPGGETIEICWMEFETTPYWIYMHRDHKDKYPMNWFAFESENAARLVQILIDHYSRMTAQIK